MENANFLLYTKYGAKTAMRFTRHHSSQVEVEDSIYSMLGYSCGYFQNNKITLGMQKRKILQISDPAVEPPKPCFSQIPNESPVSYLFLLRGSVGGYK